MSKANDTPRRWFSPWRSTETRPQDDPADVGTAFGLDLSFHDGADAAAAPAAVQAAAPPAGLSQRLAGRRKPKTA